MRRPGPTTTFLAVTFSVSWGLWLPLVLGARLPGWYYYLGALGPASGAAAALVSQGGWDELGRWLRQRLGRTGPGWLWGLVLGGLGGTAVLALGWERVMTGSWGTLNGLGTTAELPGWPPVAVAALLTLSYGLCEELGWRGWLFPAWSRVVGPQKASLAVAGVWCLWHLPAFFCNPTYQSLGWAILGWVFSLVAGSVLLSWMITASQGSLGPVVVWHSVFDFLTISDASGPFLAPLLSMAVVAVVPLVWRPLNQPRVL